MDAIREMYDYLKQALGKSSIAHQDLFEPEGHTSKLLKGIVREQYKSQNDALYDIYGVRGPIPSNSPQNLNYLRVKSRLIDRLIKAFSQLNFSSRPYSKYFQNTIVARRELSIAELLMWLNLNNAMKLITLRVLKKAKYYHMTYETMRCYELLSTYLSNHAYRKSKFLENSVLYTKSFEIFSLEKRIIHLRDQVQSEFLMKTNITKNELENYRMQLDALGGLVRQHRYRDIVIQYAITNSIVFRLEGKFVEAIECLLECFEFIDANPDLFGSKDTLRICFYGLRCAVMAGDIDKAMIFFNKSPVEKNYGSSNWFQFRSLEVLLYFNISKWESAAQVFKTVVQHEKFRKDERRVELWSLYEGFLRFLIQGQTDLPSDLTTHGETFNINHHLQQMELARHDKYGLNISIQILQVCYYLRLRSFDMLNSQIVNFRAYFYRKFSGRTELVQFQRLKSLIDMLVICMHCDYNLDAVLKLAKEKDWAKNKLDILTKPNNLSDQFGSRQIIEELVPFDEIWKQIEIELRQIDEEQLITRKMSDSKHVKQGTEEEEEQ